LIGSIKIEDHQQYPRDVKEIVIQERWTALVLFKVLPNRTITSEVLTGSETVEKYSRLRQSNS